MEKSCNLSRDPGAIGVKHDLVLAGRRDALAGPTARRAAIGLHLHLGVANGDLGEVATGDADRLIGQSSWHGSDVRLVVNNDPFRADADL